MHQQRAFILKDKRCDYMVWNKYIMDIKTIDYDDA